MTDDYTAILERQVAKLKQRNAELEQKCENKDFELRWLYQNLDIHRRVELYTTILAQVKSETDDWRVPWVVAWRHGIDPFEPNAELRPAPKNPDIAERFRECDIGETRVSQLYKEGMAILRDNPELKEWVIENYPESFRALKP